MNKIYKILISILLLSVLVTVVNAKEDEQTIDSAKDINISGELSTGYTPDLFIQVCCMEKEYYNIFGMDYFQIPISIETWNRTLYPIKNTKVNVRIYSTKYIGETGKTDIHLLYNTTKYTDSLGKVKFGFSQSYANYVLFDTHSYKIYIEAKISNKISRYYKYFDVYGDDSWNNIKEDELTTTALYRLWNPNSGDHFYTVNIDERNDAIAGGWKNEGICCYVYGKPPMIYNPNSLIESIRIQKK